MSLYALDGKSPQLHSSVWIAPTASVIGDVHLGENASVWFGVVIRCDNEPIVIGRDSNIQDNSVLHSDPGKPLTIGEGVTIGHNATVHGCTIGDNSLIGIGAVVLNNAVIGKNCLIGAGALVTERAVIPDNSLVLGSPASVKKQLGEGVIAALRVSAQHYVENAKRFRDGLRAI